MLLDRRLNVPAATFLIVVQHAHSLTSLGTVLGYPNADWPAHGMEQLYKLAVSYPPVLIIRLQLATSLVCVLQRPSFHFLFVVEF